MGSYSYCQNDDCGAPLGVPNVREVDQGHRNCDHCGKRSDVYDTMADAIERLEWRIEELEELVTKLSTPEEGAA